VGPDKERLEKYVSLAGKEEKTLFLGRLATYRYLDMHQVIDEALSAADRVLERLAVRGSLELAWKDSSS